MPDETPEQIKARLCSEAVLTRRRDHQPTDARPSTTSRVSSSTTIKNRLYGYRDKVMAILATRMATEHFLTFDTTTDTVLGSYQGNTELARYSDLLHYLESLLEIHERSGSNYGVLLPAGEHAMLAYLESMHGLAAKRSTIDRRLASLVWWHRFLGFDDPRGPMEVSAKIREIRNGLKAAGSARQKRGLTYTDLAKATSVYRPEIPRDACDMALLFTAYESMCRRSELSRMDWDDIESSDDQSGLLTIPYSKTDQDAEGAVQYLSPVSMTFLQHWKSVSGRNTGKVFRGIYSDGSIGDGLSEKGITRAMQRIAKRIGVDPRQIGAHSTRIGATQDLLADDTDYAAIMQTGRWKGIGMVVSYGRKINAKRGAMAKLTAGYNWNQVPSLDAPGPGLPPLPDESDERDPSTEHGED